MKLKEEYVKLPKEMLYETYLRIVAHSKNYDNITRSKMLEEILTVYQKKDYIYHICTRRELDFLKYAKNRQLDINDIKKYEWEIRALHQKCIFSVVTFEVFEEQKQNVEDALALYAQNDKSGFEDVIIMMISKVRTNAKLLTKALISLITSMYNVDEKGVYSLMGSPLFQFYCEFSDEYVSSFRNQEEFVSYRDYYDILDDLQEARKIYSRAGVIEANIQDDFDIFYYGFPIRNAKVKKMYQEIKKRWDKTFLFQLIEEARVLNERILLPAIITDEKLLKLVNDALDEMPCAAMNGFTPKKYEEEVKEEVNLDKEFTKIPQNNAHLCKKAADEYYKLYLALLDYVNKKYKIHEEIPKIYQQQGLDVNLLMDIDKYLWEHKEIIDDFIVDNPVHFNEEELEEIKEFKNSVTSKNFIIVGMEKEYAKILSEDGKLYMVKGVRSDFDKIMNPKELPKIIGTTLLMFKGNIIYNSFFENMDIVLGNDMKKDIINQMNSALVHYHL